MLSGPRFAPYLAAAAGDADAAIELEWWNLQVASAFVVPLNSGRYHRPLWVPTLNQAFPGVTRRVLHEDFQKILGLRNRIMHHEPIHHRHLQADHDTVYRLLAHLSEEMVHELAARDGVPNLLARRGGVGQQRERDG
ncbi:hypothetical protein GCM10009609_19070 [Pseudonocardia aurantiaca]|uniref:Abi-like protein n=1 Tax=Pseudonocardia aurantiaca TaxID=75290 RepID=A0ABW4FNX2_9PSEU